MSSPDLLLAGEIGKPHGIAGDVYVVVISDDPHRFDPGSRLIHDDGRTLVVENARSHRNRFLVKFAGVDSREDAESLRGALYVPAAEARSLDEGEFWTHDIVGCTAVSTNGETLGTVAAVVPGSAQDLLEITTARGPRLVPLVREIVVTIDPEAQRVVLDPPGGLFE